jgi:hypothetical protein
MKALLTLVMAVSMIPFFAQAADDAKAPATDAAMAGSTDAAADNKMMDDKMMKDKEAAK